MNWTEYFDSTILRRGRDYYRKEKVKGYTQTEDGCIARVLGTHVYNVRISGIKSGFLRFNCDCAYAAKGFNCKHEAAVMYKWNSENSDYEIEGPEYESDKGKTYFNLKNIIENSDISSINMEKAQELVEENEVEITDVDMYYISGYNFNNGELAMTFTGVCNKNSVSPIKVEVSFTKDEVINSYCTYAHRNSSYYGYYSPRYDSLCEHRAAILLMADKYIAKYNPGDDTDYNGSRILSGYKKMSSARQIEDNLIKSKVIRLLPRLHASSKDGYYEMSVSFKIGIEKLYILKRIPELIAAKEKHGSMKLGKNFILSFMDNDFDEKSEKYYSIIDDAKKEADYIQERYDIRSYYYNEVAVIKDQINLSPEMLDRFYEASYGETLELNGFYINGKKSLNKVKIGKCKISTDVYINEIHDRKGQFNGLICKAELPYIFKGKQHNYAIDEEKGIFTRIEEMSPMMELLLDNAYDGVSEFTIGKRTLPEFYYRLLPQMMDSPDLNVHEPPEEIIQNNIPPECELTFYMDADEDLITGKIIAKYGEEEFYIHTLRDSDYPLPENRDITFEQNAIDTLMQYLPDENDNGETFSCEKNGDNTFNLLNDGLKELMGLGEIKASKDFEKLKIRRAPQIRLGISVESGIMNLDVSTDDMTEDELLELLESYRKKKKFFKLRNGEYIRLEQDDALEELMATMQAMGISAKEFTKGKLHLPLYRAIYVNKLLEEHDEIAADRDKNFKNLVRNFNTIKDADVDVPGSLERVLRGYQKYGFKWLTMISELGFGGILADEMGLGKTLQVISMLLYQKEKRKEAKENRLSALIVCPASLVYNWEEEFKRFAPDIEIRTVTGTQTDRKKLLSLKKRPEVLVTSYDLLKRDIGLYESLEFDYEIIDEAQYIKNAAAAASKSVKVINSRHRFALTGTPIENRLSELWSIFDYLMPGFLYTYDRFRNDFESPITKFKDEDATKQLKNMVSPFILRRLKADVLKDLPDKIEEIRFSRFDSKQRKLYDAQVTHMKKVLESEDYKSGKDKLKVLAELTKIRQICCDPELITAGYDGESAKRQSCIELVQSAIDGGHKILLFSQFTSMLEILEKELHSLHIEYYKITGQTSKEDRIKLVHSFNENEVPLFLISLKAGGTGLNLTGADVVIHYDPWWNLAAQNQATDRAHRIGQTKNVSVFKLIAKDTIEEKIVDMQNAKKDLADAILSGEGESLANMTKDQLMELLS